MVAQLRRRHGLHLLGGDDLGDVEIDVRRAQEQVFPGFLRAAARRDDKRHVRALGDLERAVVEGQQLAGLAAGALRVDADAADIPLEIIHRGEDGFDRLAVVVPVDGQKAGAGHDASHHKQAQILRLGDIGEVILAQRVELGDRVKGRAVVDHHQKAPVLRQLFKPLDVRVHAGEEADHVPALRDEKAADFDKNVMGFIQSFKERGDKTILFEGIGSKVQYNQHVMKLWNQTNESHDMAVLCENAKKTVTSYTHNNVEKPVSMGTTKAVLKARELKQSSKKTSKNKQAKEEVGAVTPPIADLIPVVQEEEDPKTVEDVLAGVLVDGTNKPNN